MAHPVPFGAEVLLGFGVHLQVEWDPFGDRQTEALEAPGLGRVVREQPELAHTEVGQDLRPDAVLAGVHRQPQLEVGVDRVEPLVLQPVGAQLVADSDAPALVTAQVHHRSPTEFGNAAHRLLELRAAVTLHTGEHVAGQAFAVETNQDRLVGAHVAHHEREVRRAVEHALEGVAAELAPHRREASIGHRCDESHPRCRS